VNISLKLLRIKVKNSYFYIINKYIYIYLYISINVKLNLILKYIEKNYTFGFLHIKAVDDASHDNRPDLKVNFSIFMFLILL